MSNTKRKKHVLRKEIKQPDEITSLLTRLLDLYAEHTKSVWLVIGGIAVVALIGWSIMYSQNKKYERYHYLITKAIDEFNKTVNSDKIDMDKIAKLSTNFQSYAEDAPGKLKKLAMFYAAQCMYREGKYDPASTILSQLKDNVDDDAFNALVYFDLYKCYASMHQYKRALDVVSQALQNLYVNPYQDLMKKDQERYKKYVGWSSQLKNLIPSNKKGSDLPVKNK